MIGSNSQDADRASFSHADAVQSIVIEGHHCVNKSGVSLHSFGSATSCLPPFRIPER